MDPTAYVLLAWLVISIFGLAGGYVAHQKHRPMTEGVILALFFGPFGLIVEACLPTLERMPAQRVPTQQPTMLTQALDVALGRNDPRYGDPDGAGHLAEMQERLTRPRVKG
jgi:hypothetical protein